MAAITTQNQARVASDAELTQILREAMMTEDEAQRRVEEMNSTVSK